jgi:hypothetical protein
MALSKSSIARCEACKNLSSWDLMSIPYVISMMSAPVTLAMGMNTGHKMTAKGGSTYN